MINLLVYSVFMGMGFFSLMIMGFFFYFYDFSLLLEWSLYSYNSMNLEVIILFDWISLLFVGFIMFISSMIFIYSVGYMGGDLGVSRFIMLMLMFIMSMIAMIMSPNIISIMFGWDGLGLVSYCLVIYYHNHSSFNSGMVTVLTNRVGDVGLLLSIGLLSSSGSWNLWVFSSKLVVFIIILAALTKSAQMPFSYWLPLAMAAPTPVSALVHSSTLVTAGVYLLVRFNSVILEYDVSWGLMILSVLTMFMSGLMANFETDLKKVIALSTLSQLGLMMFSLSLGLKMFSFYHLLTHALFKSLLFMCAGVIIHLMGNNQDIRFMGSLNSVIPFVMTSFYIANFALCGFPFMSGFYSKDLIMEMVYVMDINLVIMGIAILALMLTVSYSFRLFYVLFFGESKTMSFNYFNESSLMNISMVMLVIFSVIMGSILNWVFFFDYYMAYMSITLKLLTIMVCVVSLLISMVVTGGYSSFLSVYYVKFTQKIGVFFFSMFCLGGFMAIIYKPTNNMAVGLYNADKTWFESSKRLMVLAPLKYYFKFGVNYYYMYMFMAFMIMVVLMSFFI